MDTPTFHQQAEDLREQEKFTEALDVYTKVIKNYYTELNYSGVVDALGGQSLTYKHLYLVDPQEKYLQLCRGSAQSSLEIAKQHHQDDLLFRCYFNLGEVDMLAKDYQSAVDNYQHSFDLIPNNSVEKCRALSHLAEAQYYNGEKLNVNKNLIKSLDILHRYRSQVDDYTANVWETGILMKLAAITNDQKYITASEKIIDSDDRLIIRKRQLEELKRKLK